MDITLNSEELEALYGLPHMQQITYLRGIRPYMDVKTGITGIKRRISYQSIAEQLYVEPHQGIKSQSFSRDQVRRAVAGLARAGIIDVQSEGMQLIFNCLLASRHFSVQNKAAINPPQKAVTNPSQQNLVDTGFSSNEGEKADIAEPQKAAIPLINNNYIYLLLSQFEKFWSLYPEKKSRAKAQAAFEQLNPDNALFEQLMQALQQQITHVGAMKAAGSWVAPWKYPANWLAQRSWEDELTTDALQESNHAKPTNHHQNHRTSNDLFCPPDETTDDDVPRNNVIVFQTRKAY